MAVTLRPEIAALPPYRQGRAAAAEAFKLSSNENPHPTHPAILAAIGESNLNRYPDGAATALRARLAERAGVSIDEVHVGAGSVSILQQLIQAAAGPGDEVVYAWRSFEAYPILVQLAGAASCRVPLALGARHDLPAMAAAITPSTSAVILCTPNNPTGPAIRQHEFDEFMEAAPTRVLVILDEAYVEFTRGPDVVDARAALDRYPNLLVTRTFSKAYGLAGLRVGYAVGHADVVAPIRACVTPFSVSSVAQAAAMASLAAESELLERVGGIVDERSRVVAALGEQGWTVPQAEGNFVWIAAGADAERLASHLSEASPVILARPFAGEGVRVTVGSAEENDHLLATLAGFPDRF